MPEPLHNYARFRKSSLPEFLADHCAPLLVVTAHERADSGAFKTLPGAKQEPALEELVYLIQKRAGRNSFASMITIGRAKNNDLVLDGSGVSKFHAYFMKEGAAFALTDAGATLGTTVNLRKIAPKTERVHLQTGDAISFGDLKATFYTAEGFFSFVQGLG